MQKNYKKNFNKDLIKRFTNTYEFCNGDINKCLLLLRKGVYTYEYMGSTKRFDETFLSDKKEFYSSLNTEDITDVDNRHAKRVFKHFNNKNLMIYLFRVIHYYLQMYWKTLKINVLKYMN